MRGELEDRLTELGLTDAVELRGHVPLREGLLDLYRASHAFLHVSWTEGFPMVLIEAFASGVPVVATAVGGIALEVGGAAILIEPGDPAGAPFRDRHALPRGDRRLRRHRRVSGVAGR